MLTSEHDILHFSDLAKYLQWSPNIRSSKVISRLQSQVEGRWEGKVRGKGIQQSQWGSLFSEVHGGASLLMWYNPENHLYILRQGHVKKAFFLIPALLSTRLRIRQTGYCSKKKKSKTWLSTKGFKSCFSISSRNQTHSCSGHTLALSVEKSLAQSSGPQK